MVMAANGTTRDFGFFLSVLVIELAAWNDLSLAEIIARWTAPPATNTPFVQDVMRVYMTAHIALARLASPLPTAATLSETSHAIEAVAHILYWLNRCDLPMEERKRHCVPAIALLSRHSLGASAGALWELQNSFLMEGSDRLPGSEPVHILIGEFFKPEIVEIFRQALLHPEHQKGYFNFPQYEEILAFAITSIGQWGNLADINFLRRFSNDQKLGRAAIGAIKMLEDNRDAV